MSTWTANTDIATRLQEGKDTRKEVTGDILFMAEQTKKLLISFQKKLSPKHCLYQNCPARGRQPTRKGDAIKRISAVISRKVRASMTVEASILLPLFLFFFLNLGSAIELVRLHGNMELGLCSVGRQLSIYGGMLVDAETKGEETNAPWWAELGDMALSYTYIRETLIEYVGEEYLNSAPILNGAEGLNLLESELVGADDCIDIVVTYQVKPFGGLLSFKPFRMANRYYAHLWNGYAIPVDEQTKPETDFVYVTENGEVYHEDERCWHLLLHVEETSCEEAYQKRNTNGERYLPCKVCARNGLTERVFLTQDGTAIHCDRNCSGLKRTVYHISRKDAGKYRPCSNCTGG